MSCGSFASAKSEIPMRMTKGKGRATHGIQGVAARCKPDLQAGSSSLVKLRQCQGSGRDDQRLSAWL